MWASNTLVWLTERESIFVFHFPAREASFSVFGNLLRLSDSLTPWAQLFFLKTDALVAMSMRDARAYPWKTDPHVAWFHCFRSKKRPTHVSQKLIFPTPFKLPKNFSAHWRNISANGVKVSGASHVRLWSYLRKCPQIFAKKQADHSQNGEMDATASLGLTSR